MRVAVWLVLALSSLAVALCAEDDRVAYVAVLVFVATALTALVGPWDEAVVR